MKSTIPKITSPVMMELCKLRDEFPHDTYPVVMEYCVNKNLDDISRKYLNDMNDIGVNEEGREKKIHKMKV